MTHQRHKGSRMAGCALMALVALAPCAEGAAAKPAARPGAAQKPIVFVSSAPRFVKLALTEDGEKSLLLAFDESSGNGKGYDMLYVISTANGATKYITQTASKKTDSAGDIWTFNSVQLPVVLKPGLKGGKIPFKLDIAYSREKESKSAPGYRDEDARSQDFEEKFLFESTMAVVSNGTWTYRIAGEWTPGTSTNELDALYLLKSEVAMKISSLRPEYDQKPVGIGVDYLLGEYTLDCSKDDKPVPVDFMVKTTNDVALVQETMASDKLTLKVVTRTGHSMRSSGGG